MDLFPETIKIILLLFPGLVALFTDELITGSAKDRQESLDRLFVAFLYAISSFAITLVLLKIVSYIPIFSLEDLDFVFNVINGNIASDNAINGIFGKFMLFLIVYLICGFLSGLIFGYFMASQANEKSVFSRLLNFLRKRLNKPDISGGMSPWDKLFCNRESQIIEIIRPDDGFSVKGFLKDFTFAGDKVREITLEGIEEVNKWNDYITKVDYVYYHFDSGTIIKVFDKTEFLEAVEKLRKEKDSKKD